MGYPTVFPTGVLVYNKEKAYNGYTIYPSAKGALLIDMNGNEVNLWAGLGGFPNKILPGGYVMVKYLYILFPAFSEFSYSESSFPFPSYTGISLPFKAFSIKSFGL